MTSQRSNATIQPLNISALNQALQPMVYACFWGAVVTAIALPIAGAVGGVVAGKIKPEKK